MSAGDFRVKSTDTRTKSGLVEVIVLLAFAIA